MNTLPTTPQTPLDRLFKEGQTLVGRDEELNALKNTFLSARDQKQSHLLTLSGHEGIGKSRLVTHFRTHFDTFFSEGNFLSGASYTPGCPPYASIGQILKKRFYLPRDAHNDHSRKQLLSGIKTTLKHPLAEEIAHLIAHLLNIPWPQSKTYERYNHDAARITSRAHNALVRFLEKDAEQEPLVLLFEETHLAAPESLELLKFLHENLASSPILFIVVTNPSLESTFPWLFEAGKRKQHVHLRPLSDEETRNLVQDILQPLSPLPTALVDLICAHAMGQPARIRQVLSLLLQKKVLQTHPWSIDHQKIDAFSLPGTFKGLAQARIDSLDDEERTILSRAALLGTNFPLEAVQSLMRLHSTPSIYHEGDDPWPESDLDTCVAQILHDLHTRDIIRLRPEEQNIAGCPTFFFKHELERTLAASLIPEEERASCHHQAAQWFHRIHEEDPQRTDYLEIIATHYEAGKNPLRAASFYEKAGRRAARTYSNQSALRYLHKALDLLSPHDHLRRTHILKDLGDVQELQGDTQAALDTYESMLQHAWSLGDRPGSARALNRIGRIHRTLGNHQRALSLLQRAHDLFERVEDEPGLALCLNDIGQVHTYRGEYARAKEHYQRALALYTAHGDETQRAITIHHLGALTLNQGDFKQALHLFREALELRKTSGDRRGTAGSLNNLAVICHHRGEHRQARSLYTEVEAIAESIGDRLLLGAVQNNLAEVMMTLGELPEAEQKLHQAIESAREIGGRYVLFDTTRNLGHLHLKRGKIELALQEGHRALEMARDLGARDLEGIALRSLGEMYASTIYDPERRKQDAARAETYFTESIQLLRDIGHFEALGRAVSSYGNHLLEKDRMEEGKLHLEEARTIFAKLDMKGLLQKTEETIGELV